MYTIGGTGIAGMSAAYFLKDIMTSVYEKADVGEYQYA